MSLLSSKIRGLRVIPAKFKISRSIERFDMTSRLPYWCSKHWNSGHVGVPKKSCGIEHVCFTQGKLSFNSSNTTAVDQVNEYDPIQAKCLKSLIKDSHLPPPKAHVLAFNALLYPTYFKFRAKKHRLPVSFPALTPSLVRSPTLHINYYLQRVTTAKVCLRLALLSMLSTASCDLFHMDSLLCLVAVRGRFFAVKIIRLNDLISCIL